MGVIYDLCGKNKFYALHLNVSRNAHVMSLSDQMRFVHNITSWQQKLPAVYHGHLAYVEFERFGVKKRPLYINIVRKPLDRLVSYYYFLRFGDTFRPYLKRTKQGDKEVRLSLNVIIKIIYTMYMYHIKIKKRFLTRHTKLTVLRRMACGTTLKVSHFFQVKFHAHNTMCRGVKKAAGFGGGGGHFPF